MVQCALGGFALDNHSVQFQSFLISNTLFVDRHTSLTRVFRIEGMWEGGGGGVVLLTQFLGPPRSPSGACNFHRASVKRRFHK